MSDNQDAMKRLHDDYRRQLEESQKLKEEEEEWLRLHTIDNDDASRDTFHLVLISLDYLI